MKIKKKALIIKFFLGVIVITLMSSLITSVKAKIGDSGYIKTNGEDVVKQLVGGAILHEQDISSLKDCRGDYWYKFDSQYLDTNGNDFKMVSWSYHNVNEWQMAGVTDIAKNYEEENPGWIVVGATNGDFFNINTNGQMNSNAMENGNMINPENITSNPWWRGILGFTKDNELMTGVPEISSYYNAHIYDEATFTNCIKTIQIASVNPSAISDTGVTVLTKDASKNYDLTGCDVVVGKYDIVRITASSAIFVKGQIVNKREGHQDERPQVLIDDGVTLDSVREFYLVCKDHSLDDLSINSYVKIQKDYMNKWADVYNSLSYYWKILDEGTVMFEGHTDAAIKEEIIAKYGQGMGDLSYVAATKARCLFGIKEDGSYILAVVGGSTNSGMTLSEAAYYMKEIGCVNAWDLDGGGSATLIARDEFGTLQTINVPSDAGDGTQRRVGNALLMVVRDPGFSFSKSDSTPTTVTLNRKKGDAFTDMENIKIAINGQTFDVSSDQVTLTGLKENTKYMAEVSFSINGENYQVQMPVETTPYDPGINFSPESHGFKVTKTATDEVLKTIAVSFSVDGKSFQMDDVEEFHLSGLAKNTNYVISYTCTILDQNTNETYTVTKEQEMKTLAYDLPNINKFAVSNQTKSSLIIEYEFSDNDNLITAAYVLQNGTKNNITFSKNTIDTIRFKDLDFANNDYTFQLVIEYTDPDGVSGKLTSEEIKFTKTHVHTWDDATCESPKRCTECHETEGEALGHNFENGVCTRCGASDPNYQAPKKGCNGCKKNQIMLIISLITIFTSLGLIVRKKH